MSLTVPVDERELQTLEEQAGHARRHHVDLDFGAQEFAFWRRKIKTKRNRRAEVLLVVRGPDGRLLLHTKDSYPEGGWRLLSGGVKPGEAVWPAFLRELREETGKHPGDTRYLGMATYRFQHRGRSVTFASYAIEARVEDEEVRPETMDEGIAGFRWIEPAGLARTARRLRRVDEGWRDWGRFRAVGHEMVARALAAEATG